MSQTELRFLHSELCTLDVTAKLLGTNVPRLWAWRKGADVLTPEEVAAIESQVMGKLSTLNSVAAPALACAS